jgi:hypothetical protein
MNPTLEQWLLYGGLLVAGWFLRHYGIPAGFPKSAPDTPTGTAGTVITDLEKLASLISFFKGSQQAAAQAQTGPTHETQVTIPMKVAVTPQGPTAQS